MTADVYSLRPGIRSQHHQPLQPPHRTDGKKMGRDLYQAPPSYNPQNEMFARI